MTIEDYLRELRTKLDVGPLRRRRILREIEGHLLDSVHEARIAGASRQEAERLAIERFGTVHTLASRFSEPSPRRSRHLITSFASVAALGALLAATLTFAFTNERRSPITLEHAAKRSHSTGQATSVTWTSSANSVTYRVTFSEVTGTASDPTAGVSGVTLRLRKIGDAAGWFNIFGLGAGPSIGA